MNVALFLAVCVPVRVALAALARREELLGPLGAAALVPAVGFAAIYWKGWRQGAGVETFGRPIWWNHLRPLHSALYFAFAAMALSGYKRAYVALVVDVLVGLTAFALRHLK